MTKPFPRTNGEFPQQGRTLATGSVLASAGVVGFAMVAANIAAGLVGNDLVGGLFVWRDVALVYGLAALPLAALTAAWLADRSVPVIRTSLAVAGLVIGGLVALWPASAVVSGMLTSVRWGAAWAAMCGAVLLVSLGLAAWSRWRGRSVNEDSPLEPTKTLPPGLLPVAIAAVVLVAIPWTYLAARTRDDLRRLEQLLAQSRLGEALELAAATWQVDPRAQFDGRPLSGTVAELERTVTEIATRASAPLAIEDRPEPYLARARDLAILGQTTPALAALDAAPRGAESPAVQLLRGTIHETRGQWAAGEAAYERAWQLIGRELRTAEPAAGPSPPAEEIAAALAQAITGVAFCQRKAGNYDAAAKTYAELLALAPTADTHFLLAQFYEDAQATERAHQHARQAMALDPERFDSRGELLLDKLRTRHFGCFRVGRGG
jgi:tetratricopeptide (TPR) repeat protein